MCTFSRLPEAPEDTWRPMNQGATSPGSWLCDRGDNLPSQEAPPEPDPQPDAEVLGHNLRHVSSVSVHTGPAPIQGRENELHLSTGKWQQCTEESDGGHLDPGHNVSFTHNGGPLPGLILGPALGTYPSGYILLFPFHGLVN